VSCEALLVKGMYRRGLESRMIAENRLQVRHVWSEIQLGQSGSHLMSL